MATTIPPAGQDAPLPAWFGRSDSGKHPLFDSVVLRGSGVGSLTCAIRLARSPDLRDRVVVLAPGHRESRQLINGCTLRARTIDYLEAATGQSSTSLVDELFGDRQSATQTHSQRFSLASQNPDESFSLGPLIHWMQGSSQRPLAYGLRNGHLVGRLREIAERERVVFHDGPADHFEDCTAHAPGARPLIVNGMAHPLQGVPPPVPPTHFVVASQLTLRASGRGPLPSRASFLGMRRRAGGFDTGVFYPFFDPLTPKADYYGIFYRIVRRGSFDPEAETATMRTCAEGVGAALGLDPVDAEQTRGEAVVPCLPWKNVPTHRPDYMDLYRTYSACTPVITGDGMTRAALAGWLSAESVLNAEDPVLATNRALGLWRATNRAFAWTMTTLSRPINPVLRFRPRLVLDRAGNVPDTWASVA